MGQSKTKEISGLSQEQTSIVNAETQFKLERLVRIFWAVELAMLLCMLHRIFIAPNLAMALTFLACFVCIGSVYFLIKKKKADLATTVFMSIFTVAIFAIMLRSDGLRDEAILGLPGILMFAALLGTAKLFYSLLVIMIITIAGIGISTHLGLLEAPVVENDPANALLVIVGLGVVSFSVWLMSSDLRRLLERLTEENQRVKESQAEIQKLVHHDVLTGLPNRVLLREQFKRAIARTQRDNNYLCMMFVDLDDFKSINDSLGHQTGDLLLMQVAKRLMEELRKTDTIARLSGDEFLLLIESISSKEQISIIAQKIAETVSKPYVINDQEIICTCSIGVTVAPPDGVDFETLLKNTDMAMYAAKQHGRNHFRFFDKQMDSNAQERMGLITDLRKAIKANELQLYYQPKLDLCTGRVIGAEALMRWNHPQRGFIPPDKFIPLAEASGLIVEMGAWAIQKACDDCYQWNNMGFPDLTVAVNTSSLQFKRGDISQIVQKALVKSKLTPSNLELELTESLLIDDSESLKQTLANLKQIGVTFAIDDFGTGYSNLGYLKRFDVDSLKIDKSFVQRINDDQHDAAIVKTIIQMASNLSLKTVAEGIEDKVTAEFLCEMGCDQAQGYFWSKPIVESEFREFLLKENAFQKS